MCKLQSYSSYILTFLACFVMFLPLMAQEEREEPQAPTEEIVLYGKILKTESEATEPEAEAITSLSVQELLASHQKTETPRVLVLNKEANSECWLDLEKYRGQNVKLKGTLDSSNANGPILMTVSAVEPLFQLIGQLSPVEKNGSNTIELKEEREGFLFKNGRIFNLLNADEYPNLQDFLEQKITARGTTLIDESGQLAFHLWDVRVLTEMECILFDKKDEAGNLVGTELEDSVSQKRYLLSKEGLGEALSNMAEGKRLKISGYVDTHEASEVFCVVQYELLEETPHTNEEKE